MNTLKYAPLCLFYGHNIAVTLFIYLFSELAVLRDNEDLKKSLSEFQMPTMKYGTLKIGGFGEKCMLKNPSQKLLKTYGNPLLCV